MPMRLGEMVLIIRTQDYASRNLNRLSANLGKLSKTQQLQRRMQMQGIHADRLAARGDTLARDIGMLQKRLGVESAMLQVAHQRAGAAARLADLEKRTTVKGQLRGPGPMGSFMGPAAPHLAAARGGLAALIKEENLLKDTHADLTRQLAETSPALSRMNTSQSVRQLGALRSELDLTHRRLAIIRNDMAVTQQAINKLRWDRIHQIGQGMSRLGRVMQLTGLVITGSLVAAGNAAATFSQGVSLAATQARDVNAPLAQVATRSKVLQAAILDMMQRFPAGAEEMSNAAYEIFSSLDLAQNGVFDLHRGIQILDLVNKAAVGGMTNLDDSMRGIVVTFNNFAKSGKDGIIQIKDVNSLLDTMFDIIRFGDVHMAELSQMMERIAPAARGVGHSLEDIAGPIAELTKLIGPGKTAAGFALLEQAFANRDFVGGMKSMGIEIQKSNGQLIPFLDILDKIATAVPGLTSGQTTIEEFFKTVTAAGRLARTGRVTEGQQFTIQARTAARALLQHLEDVHEAQDNIINNKEEFDNAFKAMMQDPGVQWKVFLSQLRAVAIEVGTAVLPALLGLAGMLKGLIDWFHNLNPQLRENIAKWALVVGVLALLGGITLSVVGGLVSIIGAIALMSGGLGTAGGAGLLGRLATMFTLLRALSLIGVVTITIKLILDKTGISDWIENTMDKLGKMGNLPAPLKGLVGVLNKVDEIMGLSEKDPEKGLFNPKAKLFPDGISKQTKQLWDDLHKVNGEGVDFMDTWRRAGKQAKEELKNILGAKTLADLQAALKDAGAGFDRTAQDATNMANAVRAGMEQAQQSVDQAASNMTNTFLQFKEQNTAAFGELFSGPFFQSETWSLAEEWDVKPSMKEINNDLRQQIKAFKDWRSTLRAVGKKKGATPELMKELQALGPGAMKFIEVLRKGSPGAWNQFITLWRQKQKVIENATKIDFQKQLDQWFKYGKGIAQQIILGLRSENVALDNAMKKYITSKFPNIVAEAGAAAAKEYRRQNPKPTTTTNGAKQQQSGNNVTNSNNPVTIIVHPQPGETTMHALKRGAWEYKNGGGKRGRTTPPKDRRIIVDPPGPAGPRHPGGGGHP